MMITKSIVCLWLLLNSTSLSARKFFENEKEILDVVHEPTLELERLLKSELIKKGHKDVSSINFSHVYYMCLDSSRYSQVYFEDSSFVGYLKPTYVNLKYGLLGRKRNALRTYGVVEINNKMLYWELGKMYEHNNRDALRTEIELQAQMRDNLVQFSFVIYDSDTRIVFGLTHNSVLVFDTRASPIRKYPLRNFAQCCWAELGLRRL